MQVVPDMAACLRPGGGPGRLCQSAGPVGARPVQPGEVGVVGGEVLVVVDAAAARPGDGRAARGQPSRTSSISANMIASPAIHMIAPPQCTSCTGPSAPGGRGPSV